MRTKKANLTQVIHLLVDDDLREKIRIEAYMRKTTQAQVVRDAVRMYFDYQAQVPQNI